MKAGNQALFKQALPVASSKKIEKNHLVWWGISLGGLLFILLSTLIFSIDDEVLHHPRLANPTNFRIVLNILAVIVSLATVRSLIFYKARTLNEHYLRRFKKVDAIGAFEVSRPKRNLPGPKPYKHAVLLLHGFTASTQEFDSFTQLLKEADIPFLAPMIPGFGTESARVLKETSRRDWVRVATDHFDLLADLAEEVSLVGHSMGGLIGTAVTKRRKVKHLILSAPGLYPVPGDVKYKEMLTRPVLSGFYMNLIPYLPKPMRPGRVSPSDMLDEERCKEVFQYLAVPVNAVAEVFRLQNETEILDSQYDRLTIVYGTHDLTVNMDPLFERLDQADKPYDVLKFENSAHSVLEDHERAEACKAVLRALQA